MEQELFSNAHQERGEGQGFREIDESWVVKCLEGGDQYKFLGVLKSAKQEDQIAFKAASAVFLNRMPIVLTSPLSDFN